MNDKWLSILDYARYKNISISTIRRYIKAERVKYKSISGKYFIFTPNFDPAKMISMDTVKSLKDENEFVSKIKKLEEENLELKMLVKLYEENKGTTVSNESYS